MSRPESEDDVPIFDTLPGGDNGAQGDLPGIPVAHDEEDTGRFSQVLYAAAQAGPTDPDEFLDALAAKLVKHGGGGSGGGSPPPSYTKKERRTSNLKLVVGIVAALGSGVGGSFLAVKALAEDNHRDVKEIKREAAKHADEPMHDKGADEIKFIRARIGTMETEQKVQGRDIDYIKDGIDDLKQDLRDNRRRPRRR